MDRPSPCAFDLFTMRLRCPTGRKLTAHGSFERQNYTFFCFWKSITP